jgi:hypothetical protein
MTERTESRKDDFLKELIAEDAVLMDHMIAEVMGTPPPSPSLTPSLLTLDTTRNINNNNKSQPTPTKQAKTTKSPLTTSYTTPTRGGMTMYERSVMAMEERQRKLDALKEKLLEDCTFTPHSATKSASASVTPKSSCGETVFDRLYHTETAAGRSRLSTPRPSSAQRGGSSSTTRSVDTPGGGRSTGSQTSARSSRRLTALHERDDQTQPSSSSKYRRTTGQEETARKQRLEEEEFKECTFTPRTKWDLTVRARRRESREGRQPESKKTPLKSVRTHTKSTLDCIFFCVRVVSSHLYCFWACNLLYSRSANARQGIGIERS